MRFFTKQLDILNFYKFYKYYCSLYSEHRLLLNEICLSLNVYLIKYFVCYKLSPIISPYIGKKCKGHEISQTLEDF